MVQRQRHEQGHRRIAGKRHGAGAEFVQHATEAEQVATAIYLAAASLLRRHISRRTHDGAAARQVNVVVPDASQAKIQDFNTVFMVGIEPDVAGFYVAVDQSALVGGRQPFGDLTANPQHLDDARFAAAFEPLIQRHPLRATVRSQARKPLLRSY